MEYLSGKCAYEGIVIAQTFIDKSSDLPLETENICESDVESQIKRLDEGIENAKKSLLSLKDDLDGKLNSHDLSMIEAHILLLEDPMYISDIKKYIKTQLKNAESAIVHTTDKFFKMFDNIDTPLYKQRGMDIKDVAKRLLENLSSKKSSLAGCHNKILITKEIFPTELLKLHKDGIKLLGIIMEYGGETSHVAILTKALKIPTLMGVEDIFNHNWKDNIILDTTTEKGKVISEPDQNTIDVFSKKREEFLAKIEEAKKEVNLPSITKDDVKINLYLNLGGSEEVKLKEVKTSNIAGVGLLRTELLYMKNNSFPSEEKQLEIYKKSLKEFSKEQTIIIRTLDIGADKQLSYFQMAPETNPFLGLRGIRFSLKNKEIFKTQLRAILRLSEEKNIKIMYPMITSLEEVRSANLILKEAKEELDSQNIGYKKDIEVGIMVEVPSVIMMASEFAKEVDFFSVGTNDLTQYILATDRLSETVGDLYESLHPAVFRAIDIIKKAGDNYGKKVGVCGELAGDRRAIVALLSLGIKDLSMVESSIVGANYLVRNLEYKKLSEIKNEILSASSSEEVKSILDRYIENN